MRAPPTPATTAATIPAWMLPAALSLTAGAVDAIGFLAIGGLFAAHVTGNLAVLALHLVSGQAGQTAHLLAVPVFALVIFAVTLAAGAIGRAGTPPLLPLLGLHAALLCGLLAAGVTFQPFWDPDRPLAIAVGMLAVAAMAVQNATVRLALTRTPSTAVMTTNLTQWSIDLALLAHGRADAHTLVAARARARATWPCIAGFLAGCALGAALQLAFGMWSLLMPVALAMAALPLARGEAGAAH